jgi:RNA polymerase sigma factor (TIGR02999 family)
MDEEQEITQLLMAAAGGDPEAMDEVFVSVYPRLRKIARARRRSWHGNPTLNTTALIHEAYLKVGPSSRFENRGHFFAVASKAMRQVLINYAEQKKAAKRGGGDRDVTLVEGSAVSDDAVDEIIILDQALSRLEALSKRQSQVVECLFFGGLNIAETAEALEISPATVKRDWSTARAWLYREMQTDRAPSEGATIA